MKHRIIFGVVFLFTAVLAGCSSSSGTSGKVSLTMKVATSSRAENFTGRTVQTVSRSFTPTSFKLPIMKISIAQANGMNEKIIYQCANASEADCLVDLASQTELDAITAAAASVTVDSGTYTSVSVATCAAGSSGSTTTTAKITGSGTGPSGGTWTTHATNTVDITGSGTAAETVVGNWACSTKTVNVMGGITVGTDPLNLTIVVDNYLGAVFGQMVSSGQGGCKVSGSTTNGLCVTYPALLGYVGTDTATSRRFSIAHDQMGVPGSAAKANALIIVAVTASGAPLMAYGRTIFLLGSETIAANTKVSSTSNSNYSLQYGGPSYVTETNYATFTANASGVVSFEQGGSADTFAAKFAAFDTTQTHSGTVTSKDSVDSWHYLATKLP